jgi:hypothetical protein
MVKKKVGNASLFVPFSLRSRLSYFISSSGISSTIITTIILLTNHPPLTSPYLT